jgi:hypothetical protein
VTQRILSVEQKQIEMNNWECKDDRKGDGGLVLTLTRRTTHQEEAFDFICTQDDALAFPSILKSVAYICKELRPQKEARCIRDFCACSSTSGRWFKQRTEDYR